MRSELVDRLEGCLTALVTPFRRTAEQPVDFDRLGELIAIQARGGVSGVVLCGTTGESATLTEEEHIAVMKAGIDECHRHNLLAIAGTGLNCTRTTIAMTHAAKAANADGALIVTPYYNKPDETGLRRHFARLNEVGLPIVLYNIPSRTGINLSPQLLLQLCMENDQIVGIKASNGDLNQIIETMALLRQAGSDVRLFSGDDSLTVPIMAVGGAGTISVLSNVFPHLMVDIVRAAAGGDFRLSTRLAQDVYFLATRLLQTGSNPAATKALLTARGIDCGGCREPLVELGEAQLQVVIETNHALELALMELGLQAGVDTDLDQS